MAQGHQRGWLKKERRKNGDTWMLFFRTTRESDGKRVEQKISVGTVHDFPTKASAWAEVERQQIQINKPDFRKRVTFADLAQHYQEHELGERRSAIVDKTEIKRGGFTQWTGIGVGGLHQKLDYRGSSAQYQIANSKPTFYVRVADAAHVQDSVIVRFKQEKHKRQIETAEIGGGESRNKANVYP